jgi:hypothetical protein
MDTWPHHGLEDDLRPRNLVTTFQHMQSEDLERCGSCLAYSGDPSSEHKRGRCDYLDMKVDAPDPGCEGYFRRQ